MTEDEHLDPLLNAVSDAIRKAITNSQFKAALKEAVIDSLRDDELQKEMICTLSSGAIAASKDAGFLAAILSVTKDAVTQALKDEGFIAEMLSTLTGATVMASRDEELRGTVLSVVKDAVTDSLKDDGFMADMLSTITGAAISASKDQGLRDAMLSVTKDAVADALRDEGVMCAFRDAMCQSLKDSNIYRAAAAGVVGSLNPFGRRGDANHPCRGGEAQPRLQQ